MTAIRTETVVLSEVLCQLPDVAPDVRGLLGERLVHAMELVPRRPLDPAAQATVDAGYLEPDPDVWFADLEARGA